MKHSENLALCSSATLRLSSLSLSIQQHALIPPQSHPTVGATFLAKELGQPSVLTVLNCTCLCASQNAEVTRQMTVARAAQDEVENVKKEMQDKLKAAQDSTSQQVAHKPHTNTHTSYTHCLCLMYP